MAHQAKVEARLRAYLAASKGVSAGKRPTQIDIAQRLQQYLETSAGGAPSAGQMPDNLAGILKQYLQTAEYEKRYQILPHAGKMKDTVPAMLQAFVQASQGAPTAGGGTMPKPDPERLLASYVQASQNIPSSGGGINTSDQAKAAALKGYIEASRALPSHTQLPYNVPPAESAMHEPQVQEASRGLAQAGQAQGNQLFFVNNAFNGGELSPDMLGRYDQPRYVTGCELLENMIPMPQGGITKRPGFEGLYSSYILNKKTIFIPFVFSSSDSLLLALTETDAEVIENDNVTYRDSYLLIFKNSGNEPPIVAKKHNTQVILRLPYLSSDLKKIQYAQSADVIFLAHPKYPPAKLMRYSNEEWDYQAINWMPRASAPSIWLEAIGSHDGYANRSDVWHEYCVTAIDEDGRESSLSGVAEVKVGENRKTFSQYFSDLNTSDSEQESDHEHGGIRCYPVNENYYVRIRWTAIEGAEEYRIYRQNAGVFGFIGRTTSTYFDDKGFTPDTEDTPTEPVDPFAEDHKYPSIVFLHQQRLGFASTNSKPLTIWMSQSGIYESMSKSTPPEEDDAIEVTLAAPQANRILWCISDRDGLVVGTEGGEWILKPTEGRAITPNDLSFQPQTSHGSQAGSNPVLRAGNALLFIQRGGRVVRALGYEFSSDKYNAVDVTLLARHMFSKHKITAWAWQAEPYAICWILRDDGVLCGFTFMEDQKVFAWHRHITNGKILNIACIPGADGNDQLWLLVKRKEGEFGDIYIERMRDFGNDDASDINQFTDGNEHLAYIGRCIPCLPEGNIRNGASFLHVRKINAVKARVVRSCPFEVRFGTADDEPETVTSYTDGWDRLVYKDALPIPVRSTKYKGNWNQFKSGYIDRHYDWAVPIGTGWSENKRIDLIFNNPGPATLLALVIAVEVSDMSGGQE